MNLKSIGFYLINIPLVTILSGSAALILSIATYPSFFSNRYEKHKQNELSQIFEAAGEKFRPIADFVDEENFGKNWLHSWEIDRLERVSNADPKMTCHAFFQEMIDIAAPKKKYSETNKYLSAKNPCPIPPGMNYSWRVNFNI